MIGLGNNQMTEEEQKPALHVDSDMFVYKSAKAWRHRSGEKKTSVQAYVSYQHEQ